MILPKWLDDQLVGGSNVRCLSKPSPLQVGLQVPRGIRAQTTAESDLWEYPPTTGPGFPRAGAAEGVPDRGGTPDAGSRAHVHRDSAEASSRFGDRFLKGKSAIAIARLSGKERNFSGEHFRARGYAVSTVGFELEQVRQYIRE